MTLAKDSGLSEGDWCQHIQVGLDKVAPVFRWTVDCCCPDILVVWNLVETFVCSMNSFDVFTEALMFQRGCTGHGGSVRGRRMGLGHGRSRSKGS